MSGIRKRTWKNKRGTVKSCYEITYYIQGKQCRKSGYATKQEAQSDLQRVTRAYNCNSTFGEIANAYIESIKINCKEHTIELYKAYAKPLNKIYSIKIKSISTQDIISLQAELVKSGYAKSYVNKLIDFVKSIFKYAIKNKFLSENPALDIKRVRIQKERVSFLDVEEISYFLQAVEKVAPQYYAIFYTAIFTGMRRGELLGLEWQDIDFKNKNIHIQRQIYNGKVQSLKTTKSDRIIDMSKNLLTYLRDYKLKLNVISNYVFTDNMGKPINRNTLKFHWERIRLYLSTKYPENKVFAKLHIHDLRHTFASMLLNHNAPINFIQEQMGHSSAKMTLDIYSHCLPSKKQEFINVLDKIESEHFMSIENSKAV